MSSFLIKACDGIWAVRTLKAGLRDDLASASCEVAAEAGEGSHEYYDNIDLTRRFFKYWVYLWMSVSTHRRLPLKNPCLSAGQFSPARHISVFNWLIGEPSSSHRLRIKNLPIGAPVMSTGFVSPFCLRLSPMSQWTSPTKYSKQSKVASYVASLRISSRNGDPNPVQW